MKRLILLIPIFMLAACSTTKNTTQSTDPFDPDLFTNILNEEIYQFHQDVDSLNQNAYYILNK